MWKLAEDTLGTVDMHALADWLRTEPRLTQGPLVRRFERAWSEWLGVAESVFVSSGSTANFALISAIHQRESRNRPLRVGASAVTWPTNLTPSLMLGHEVTLFDVQPQTLGVDPQQVCKAMDEGRLDLLFVTHLLGLNALDHEIVESARRNDVILLEDCCESHGAAFDGRKVGTWGAGSTFSFYFGHHMSTIEGGMVCTDDRELADLVRLVRAHGMARESTRFEELAQAHPEVDPRFLFVAVGLNFRSTDLNAFLGLRQLELLDERVAVRNRNFERWVDRLPEMFWRDYRMQGASSFALPLIGERGVSTDAVRALLDEVGVESRPVVAGNLLRQPFLREGAVGVTEGGTPVADWVHEHGLYVGNGHHVSEGQVDALAERLRKLENML